MNDVGRTAELAGVVQRLRQVSYVDVAALTYNIVDYAQTFEWEVKHMWGGKPSMIKLVYFVGRYLGVIDVPLMFIYSHHFGKLTPTQCTLLYTFGGTSALTGASAAEVLMFLRVWVLSGCTKKMGWYLTAQFTVIMASVTVLAGLYLKSLAYTTSPLPDQISCHQLTADRFMLALMYGFVLIHQVVVMMLCLYFGVATFRHSRSPLLHILYRDGTFYFAILSVVSIANISVITVGPPEYQNLFLLLQRTIHSTLATRTILKMREMASRNQYSATTIAAGRPHGMEGEILHPGGHQNQTMSALKFRSRAQQWISEGLVTQAFPGGMLPSVYEGEEGREDHSFTYSTRQEDDASTQNMQL